MDREEALQVLDLQVKSFRDKNYHQLSMLIGSGQVYTAVGASGVEYQIEVLVFWDRPDRPEENLRVILSIDDGRFLSSLMPLTTDFIMAPDGDFIGE